MARLRQRLALFLSLAGLAGLSLTPLDAIAGTPEAVKGAKIYCYMRSSNNDHEVSWEAAYALIKRQKSGMFKTSPVHAAVMITEAVVEDPGSYPNCGQYLGDLFGGSTSSAKSPESVLNSTDSSNSNSFNSSNSSDDNRYSY
ncbi:putative bacterial type II secretion system protein [Synechococcus sp. PROS-9-1]|uniref:DUF6554 family protein n=1 Tax=Synechococcus sp. PROS-9-1 TaxID=1968775 RepID=UPI001646B294|nr:DUF6554 family protein [Synechococcus sp. PROS-9-1]QNJ30477.1 putative bacterial type II secretion system protein [Synechococcus sp. PROS-9-1]